MIDKIFTFVKLNGWGLLLLFFVCFFSLEQPLQKCGNSLFNKIFNVLKNRYKIKILQSYVLKKQVLNKFYSFV